MAENTGVAQGRSPSKRQPAPGLRLDFEETQHSWEPAATARHKQGRRRHTQGAAGTVHAQSPSKRPSGGDGTGSRLTQRALSLSGSGDSRVLHTAEWLDDLRLRLGHPKAVPESENQPPRAAGADTETRASPARRRPSDAAVLAAALAARLQVSPSEHLLPSSDRRGSRSRRAGGASVSAFHSPRRTASGSSPATASPSRRRTTPAALSDIPLTPPRPPVSKPDRLARRRSASAVTPGATSGRAHSSMAGGRANELSLVEKAVVVGVGTLLYPFVRTPSSTGSSAAAAQHSAAKQDVQAGQKLQQAQHLLRTPAPVSNLDARLTGAAASPSKTATISPRAADVFAATATFTPPQSPSREPQAGAASSGASVGTAAPPPSPPAAPLPASGAATPSAGSPRRTPLPVHQAPPSPVSQLGGYDEQELLTVTPPPELAEPTPTTFLPASPASKGIAAGLLMAPARASGERDWTSPEIRSLRETYGSIPAAAAADRKAFDASIAAAMAELAAANASPGSAADAPSGAAAADASSESTADAASGGVEDARGAAEEPEAGAAAALPSAERLLAGIPSIPESPAREVPPGPAAATPPKPAPNGSSANKEPTPAAAATASPITKPAAAPAAAALQPATAKPRRQWVPVGAVLALLCLLGIGLLAAYDPAQGCVSPVMASMRAQQAAAAVTATGRRTHAATVQFGRQAPAYAEQVALEGWHGVVAAAAATQRGITAAPAAAQHIWRSGAAAVATDTQAVVAAARRLGSSAGAFAERVAAAAGREAAHAAGRPAAWITKHARESWAWSVATSNAVRVTTIDSARSAADAATKALQQDWHRMSAAVGRITGRVPRSGEELAAAAVAAGSSAQHAAVTSATGAARKLRTARTSVAQLQWPAAPVPPPPSAASRAWSRITGGTPLAGAAAAAAKPKQAAPKQAAAASRQQTAAQPKRAAAGRPQSPDPASAPAQQQRQQQAWPAAASGARQTAAAAGTKADKAKSVAAKPSVKPVASPPAKPQRHPAQRVMSTRSGAAVTVTGASKQQATAAPPASAAVRSPAGYNLPAPGSVAQALPGQTAGPATPGAGVSATATGCLAALAVCGLVAHYLGWLPGASSSPDEQLGSTGEPDIMYGGPDADDFGVPDDPFDAHDFDSARAVAVNPRRHTIATTQPQGREFMWLRPNEVVTRAGSASGGRGLDYLWLRSRLVVKLSPEARGRVARSSTMKNLSKDTSFRSPMGALRDIAFTGRGRHGGVVGGRAGNGNGAVAAAAAAAADEAPATLISAGAAAVRRASTSRRLTLG